MTSILPHFFPPDLDELTMKDKRKLDMIATVDINYYVLYIEGLYLYRVEINSPMKR